MEQNFILDLSEFREVKKIQREELKASRERNLAKAKEL
jgi:hypothetical protein